jgi:hypothetical protein
LTLLPVERSFWVVASSEAVDCSERRFWRTDAERTIPVISSYLSGVKRKHDVPTFLVE